MDCYKFIPPCENYFATSGFKNHYQISFVTTLLKKKALNQWKQYKRKIETETLVTLIWAKFGVFLQYSLGETQVFVNNLWNKFCTIYHYKLVDIMDWSMHLEHLQSILKKFDLAATLSDNLLIWYFLDGLWLVTCA